MSIEDAVGLIIKDYCIIRNTTPTGFARNANIGKSTINKIVLFKYGKVGISGTILDLIAKGMNLNTEAFRNLIKDYQNGKRMTADEFARYQLISNIIECLHNYNVDDLAILYKILLKSNSSNIKDIELNLENME